MTELDFKDYITSTRVYGLVESIVASALSFNKDKITVDKFESDVKEINEYLKTVKYSDKEGLILNKRIKRALSLGSAKPASGHDCWIKGVIVQFNMTAPQSVWQQVKRYHWFDFISSESSMHCILSFNLTERFYPDTPQKSIDVLNEAIVTYNSDKTEENYEAVINAIPSGFMLCARITTNYMQLKNIYFQRKTHKLRYYRHILIPWMLTLPMFDLVVQKSEDEK